MLTVEVDGRTIEVTPHAIYRFRDRLYPSDEISVAAQRLGDKIKDTGRIRQKRPGWAFKTGDLKHKILTEGYLIINQTKDPGQPKREVAFPLTLCADGYRATTALVQGWDRAASVRP